MYFGACLLYVHMYIAGYGVNSIYVCAIRTYFSIIYILYLHMCRLRHSTDGRGQFVCT